MFIALAFFVSWAVIAFALRLFTKSSIVYVGLGFILSLFVLVGLEKITKSEPADSIQESSIKKEEIKAEPKHEEPVNQFSKDSNEITHIEQRFKENHEHMKKYYANPARVLQANEDVHTLTLAKASYGDNGKTVEEKALGQKASSLITQVSQQAREMYASSVEEIFIKSGFDVQVKAFGAEKKQLSITYALMSKPLVYQFQNEVKLNDQATQLGFTKLVFTNGFESDLGKTWTVNL